LTAGKSRGIQCTELPVLRNTECGAIPQRSRHCNRGFLQHGWSHPKAIALHGKESEKALQGTGSGSQETILKTCTLRGKRMAGVRFIERHAPPLHNAPVFFPHPVRMTTEGL
jgi:hypothetical protein